MHIPNHATMSTRGKRSSSLPTKGPVKDEHDEGMTMNAATRTELHRNNTRLLVRGGVQLYMHIIFLVLGVSFIALSWVGRYGENEGLRALQTANTNLGVRNNIIKHVQVGCPSGDKAACEAEVEAVTETAFEFETGEDAKYYWKHHMRKHLGTYTTETVRMATKYASPAIQSQWIDVYTAQVGPLIARHDDAKGCDALSWTRIVAGMWFGGANLLHVAIAWTHGPQKTLSSHLLLHQHAIGFALLIVLAVHYMLSHTARHFDETWFLSAKNIDVVAGLAYYTKGELVTVLGALNLACLCTGLIFIGMATSQTLDIHIRGLLLRVRNTIRDPSATPNMLRKVPTEKES